MTSSPSQSSKNTTSGTGSSLAAQPGPRISMELGMIICAILSLISLLICCHQFRDFWGIRADRRERRRRREELSRYRELERIRQKHKEDPALRTRIIEKRIETRTCGIENIRKKPRKESFDSFATEQTASTESSDDSDRDGAKMGDEESCTPPTENCDENVCTICLQEFEPGDKLAWSRELRCNHCFHAECLTPWLMINEECPYCRTTLLENDDFLRYGGDDQLNENLPVVKVKKSNNDTASSERKEEDDLEAQRIESKNDDYFEIIDGQITFKRKRKGCATENA